MRVYRFRGIEYLLGEKYQELERQSIYFASPDQLNDPMEGFRDIVWKGDKIVWTNFFKHFVYCLCESYSLLKHTGDSKELGADDIPILGRWDEIPDPQSKRLFDDFWDRFLNLQKTSEIIEALAKTNRKIRYRELELYLRVIQVVFLTHVLESNSVYESISESERLQLTEILTIYREKVGLILIALPKIENLEPEEANVRLRKIETFFSNERVIRQLNNLIFKEKLGENYRLTFFDFLIFDLPKKYLKKIEMLLWPSWYTACFMSNYHNSSVWGNYGDKHEGACLIFESGKIGHLDSFQLYEMTDKGDGTPKTKIPFVKVRYANKPGEVDFFRSIGRLETEDLMILWYTDEAGNKSKCGDHLSPDGDTFNWRDGYWASFYRDITTKTKDWEYEQEYRLILEDMLGEFTADKDRTLLYDFNSLKGIIFGIKIADEDRLKIIKIIQDKCEKYNRTDFKFFQAYYSPEHGNIRKYEIPLADAAEWIDLINERIDEINQQVER